MAKWWMTDSSATRIIPVDVASETECFVFLARDRWNGQILREPRRTAKRSTDDNYHESWGAAHAFLLEAAREEVEFVTRRLQRARSRLGEIESLKEPEEVGK